MRAELNFVVSARFALLDPESCTGSFYSSRWSEKRSDKKTESSLGMIPQDGSSQPKFDRQAIFGEFGANCNVHQ
ncbi:MAG TPA: hypothetical protein DIW81_13460 [Planctomycetaceae bacterium]|nr:hypothetical protein [Rubinisphaera sp.]HCS52577.1 hypothetical protein [Planctomycetaceae bacterium]